MKPFQDIVAWRQVLWWVHAQLTLIESVEESQALYRRAVIADEIIRGACLRLKCQPEQLLDRIDQMLQRIDSLQAELVRVNAKLAAQERGTNGT